MSENAYLLHAVRNLRDGQMTLGDDDAGPIARAAQNYLRPLPTVYPFFANYQGGAGVTVERSVGTGYERQVFIVSIRYVLGKESDGFEGALMEMVWLRQTTVLNLINDHPDMVFEADQSRPPGLDPDGVMITNITRFGQFRDDPVHVGMEFALQVPFVIAKQKHYYFEELED